MYITFGKKQIVLAAIAAFIIGICASLSFYAVPVQTDEVGIKLPVLMYHGLCEDESRRNQYMIDPKCFENDLQYLKNHGYNTILISELIDSVKNDKPLPENPIILTFDDGYLNNYTYAYPLLKKYGMKAVISPIGISADEAEYEMYRSPLWSQCQWKELKEMSDSGLIEIQNHTYDLHHISGEKRGAAIVKGESDEEYKIRLKEDLKKANESIKKNVGKTPQTFVYPFGAKSQGTEEIVRSMGFEAILDCEEKVNVITSEDDLFHLHRFLRPDKVSSENFFESIFS